VAVDRTSPVAAPLWSGRVLEWGIVVVVLLTLMGAFERHVRVVQSQGEFAAVKSTLGALRTALVLDFLQQTVHTARPNVVAQQRNPFLLLKEVPANYAGEFAALHLETVAPGSWVFDPDCSCIGYLPMYSQGLESPTNTPVTPVSWFKVGAAAGPLQITAMDAYVWQGQLLN